MSGCKRCRMYKFQDVMKTGRPVSFLGLMFILFLLSACTLTTVAALHKDSVHYTKEHQLFQSGSKVGLHSAFQQLVSSAQHTYALERYSWVMSLRKLARLSLSQLVVQSS
mmetsp:Transcript_24807/g.43379  ORF Transcript_24807/g.43379 Transcript_24807/m.43379 type:complete len:110 (-) Transcript_24807:794-1123(-)